MKERTKEDKKEGRKNIGKQEKTLERKWGEKKEKVGMK